MLVKEITLIDTTNTQTGKSDTGSTNIKTPAQKILEQLKSEINPSQSKENSKYCESSREPKYQKNYQKQGDLAIEAEDKVITAFSSSGQSLERQAYPMEICSNDTSGILFRKEARSSFISQKSNSKVRFAETVQVNEISCRESTNASIDTIEEHQNPSIKNRIEAAKSQNKRLELFLKELNCDTVKENSKIESSVQSQEKPNQKENKVRKVSDYLQKDTKKVKQQFVTKDKKKDEGSLMQQFYSNKQQSTNPKKSLSRDVSRRNPRLSLQPSYSSTQSNISSSRRFKSRDKTGQTTSRQPFLKNIFTSEPQTNIPLTARRGTINPLISSTTPSFKGDYCPPVSLMSPAVDSRQGSQQNSHSSSYQLSITSPENEGHACQKDQSMVSLPLTEISNLQNNTFNISNTSFLQKTPGHTAEQRVMQRIMKMKQNPLKDLSFADELKQNPAQLARSSSACSVREEYSQVTEQRQKVHPIVIYVCPHQCTFCQSQEQMKVIEDSLRQQERWCDQTQREELYKLMKESQDIDRRLRTYMQTNQK